VAAHLSVVSLIVIRLVLIYKNFRKEFSISEKNLCHLRYEPAILRVPMGLARQTKVGKGEFDMKSKSIHFTGAIALSITLASCAILTAPREPATPKSYVPKEPVFEHQKGTFTDERDNKTYETVTIGTQTWMAENLSYNVNGSKCYDDSEDNCQKYGKLYNWLTAMGLPSKCTGLDVKFDPSASNSTHTAVSTKTNSDPDCALGAPYHKGICPSGWHLPSDAEWTTLTDFAGGEAHAGIRLKASSGWSIYYGSDSYGFAALPGGSYYGDRFGGIGDAGTWWTATGGYAPGLGDVAYTRSMAGRGYSYMEASKKADNISYSRSVRCVQD